MPEPDEPSVLGLPSSPAHPTETPPPVIPLLPDLPFEGTPSRGHPFLESLAGPLPSGSFNDHHGKRSRLNSPEVEVRCEDSSTQGDDYMPRLILEIRTSPGQGRQESYSPPPALPGPLSILMIGHPH